MAKPLVRVIMNNVANRAYEKPGEALLEQAGKERDLKKEEEVRGQWNITPHEENLLKGVIKGKSPGYREVKGKGATPTNLIDLDCLAEMSRKNRG